MACVLDNLDCYRGKDRGRRERGGEERRGREEEREEGEVPLS